MSTGRVQVCDFHEGMNMKHTERPPMMLVDNSALNEYSVKEGGRADGPETHTRGLCLCESYSVITSTSVSFVALTRSFISQVRRL